MSTEEKQARLREIEVDLAALRRELPPTPDDPQDFADQGADLANREQQLGLIESLEEERRKLLEE